MIPVHVDITNVARWFYVINDRAHYELNEDFPCLLPPWEFSEWRWIMPALVNQEGQMSRNELKGTVMRAQVNAFDQDSDIDELIGILSSRPEDSYITRDSDCKYIVQIIIGDVAEQWGIVFLQLDKAGYPVGEGYGMSASGENMSGLLFPLAFAISLMHCKNVELIDQPLTRQQRRKLERKGGIRYKTLVIEPFKKQVRNEAQQTGESEIKRALHICRGHFATYTEERPLFGKYSGTFWKPMHVKGNRAAGEVVKDYKISTDK